LFVVAILWLTDAEAESNTESAQGYKVSGFIEVHELQPPKDGISGRDWKQSHRTEFEVQAGGSFWRIVARYGPEHYSVYAGDGTNVYSYLVQEQTIREGGFSANPATVVPGKVPVDSTWYIMLPWLAYCSTDFLDSQKALESVHLPAPWAIGLGDPLAVAFECKVETNDSAPYLVRDVQFFRSTELLEQLLAGEDITVGGQDISSRERYRLEGAKLLKDPSGLSEPEGELIVSAWDKLGSFLIPSDMMLKRYLPQIADTNRTLITQFRVVATNIIAEPLLGNLPKPDRALFVADFRLQNREFGIRQLMYPTGHESAWLSTNDPVLLAMFNTAVEAAVNKKHFSRTSVLIAVLTVIVLPAVFWIRQNRCQQSRIVTSK